MSHPISVEQLPLAAGVQVLASNEDGLVGLDKPIGVLSHPNSDADMNRSLVRAAYDHEDESFSWRDDADIVRRVWLINRLDSPTSGVILIGLNPDITREIKQQFATHRVSKIYHALVKHPPKLPAGSWSDQLKKNVQNGKRIVKHARVVSAKTRYQINKVPTGGFPIALLKLMPLTGRTHQLRVQCMKHGHPIVGDRTYGSFSFNREVIEQTGQRRMMLHSSETHVKYAYQGKIREFKATSPLPDPFQKVLAFRPGLRSKRDSLKAPQAKRSRSETLAARRFRH